ncbi:MAG: S8 family peptidase [Brotaphodocola sp.]
MKFLHKRSIAAWLLTVFYAATVPMQTCAAFGPGVDNLSSGDPYAIYQWGLRNDGQIQYFETVNKYRYSDPDLAEEIDMANQLGAEAPIEGPDAYEVAVTNSIKGIDINIQPAWKLYDLTVSERRPVTVAVIDTGIDINHPELKDAIWVNEDEIADDGIDNDNNGFIDDVNGWNFFDDTNVVYHSKDEDGHGTHCAGTIVAKRGTMGIAGIADGNYVKVMPVKALGNVLGEDGWGEEEAIIRAIQYAEANGAEICNLSFGTREYYPRLEQVMRDSKMLFIVSSGNGDEEEIGYNIDQIPDYPSGFDLENIISVANLMFDGKLATSSNFGEKHVDMAAPGTYILSTVPENGYGYMNGTSMAAPMVTGAAAMVYSFRTDLSLQDIKPALMNTVKKLPELESRVAAGGMLDVYAALRYIR